MAIKNKEEKTTLKKPEKKKESNAGRPDKITPEILNKLEDGFSMGMTDVEASLYANISSRTFYRYLEKNPEFGHRREELKNNLKMVAKTNLAKSITQNDVTDSKWYLERKAKDEFSIRQENENKNTNLNVTADDIKNMKDDDLLNILKGN